MSAHDSNTSEDLRDIHALLKALPRGMRIASREHGFLNQEQMNMLTRTAEFFGDIAEHMGNEAQNKEQ